MKTLLRVPVSVSLSGNKQTNRRKKSRSERSHEEAQQSLAVSAIPAQLPDTHFKTLNLGMISETSLNMMLVQQ